MGYWNFQALFLWLYLACVLTLIINFPVVSKWCLFAIVLCKTQDSFLCYDGLPYHLSRTCARKFRRNY